MIDKGKTADFRTNVLTHAIKMHTCEQKGKSERTSEWSNAEMNE